ncbi:UNVERIFIED_CONTAM: hypothetical protein I5919_17130 [Aeromonas hydrophila]
MRVAIITLGILLLSPMSIAAPIARQIDLSTEIDKNKFSLGEFIDVRFVPDSLVAIFDKKAGVFKDLATNMSVITNLPTSESNNGFSVWLSENKITCFDSSNAAVILTPTHDTDAYGFAKLSIDGASIPIGKSVSISEFNIVNDGLFEGYYPVSISFSELYESDLNEGKCSGNISVRVEFNI